MEVERKSSHDTHHKRRSSGSGAHKPPAVKYVEHDVKKLVKMGFTKDQAVQALMENYNDVQLAANSLVSKG